MEQTAITNKYADNPVIERIYMDRTEGLREETIRNHVKRYTFAASHIKSGKSVVLDLCCGSGYGTDILNQANPSIIIGVDSSDEAITYAESHYPQCKFIQEDIVALFKEKEKRSWLPKSNLVIFYEAIEHLEKDAGLAVIDEIQDILTPDGVLFISTPRDIRSDRNPDHIKQWTFAELQLELEQRFGNVDLFGQDWATGDFVRQSPETASYFIAVCKEPR